MSIVTININADLSALEQQVSDLQAKVDEVKSLLSIETEQAAALSAKVDELKAKVDVLISDTYAKAEVHAAFDEIQSMIPSVVKDAPPAE